MTIPDPSSQRTRRDGTIERAAFLEPEIAALRRTLGEPRSRKPRWSLDPRTQLADLRRQQRRLLR